MMMHNDLLIYWLTPFKNQWIKIAVSHCTDILLNACTNRTAIERTIRYTHVRSLTNYYGTKNVVRIQNKHSHAFVNNSSVAGRHTICSSSAHTHKKENKIERKKPTQIIYVALSVCGWYKKSHCVAAFFCCCCCCVVVCTMYDWNVSLKQNTLWFQLFTIKFTAVIGYLEIDVFFAVVLLSLSLSLSVFTLSQFVASKKEKKMK